MFLLFFGDSFIATLMVILSFQKWLIFFFLSESFSNIHFIIIFYTFNKNFTFYNQILIPIFGVKKHQNIFCISEKLYIYIYIYIYILKQGPIWGCPRGVKEMDCTIVVSELLYYIHFWTNILRKGMNPLMLPALG